MSQPRRGGRHGQKHRVPRIARRLTAECEELGAALWAASDKVLVRGTLTRSHCEKCLSPGTAAGTVRNTGCHASPGGSSLSSKNSGLPYGLPQTKCWSLANSRGLTAKNVSAQAWRQARSRRQGATHRQEVVHETILSVRASLSNALTALLGSLLLHGRQAARHSRNPHGQVPRLAPQILSLTWLLINRRPRKV